MDKLLLKNANVLYGNLYDCYRKAIYIFKFYVEKWKNENARPPKQFIKNYFEGIFTKKYYYPKMGDLKEVSYHKNVNIPLLINEIDSSLEAKGKKPSGFSPLRPPSK